MTLVKTVATEQPVLNTLIHIGPATLILKDQFSL